MKKKLTKKQTGGPTGQPPRVHYQGYTTQPLPPPPPAPPKPKKEKKTKKAEPTSVYSNPRDLPSIRMDKNGVPVKKKIGGSIKKKK
jgi:hypothetical protein